jgi:hypothetical protein
MRDETDGQWVPPPKRDPRGDDRGRNRGDEPVPAGVVAQPDLELAGSEQNDRDHPVHEDTTDAKERLREPGSR